MLEPPKLTEEQKNLIEKEEKRKETMLISVVGCRNNETNLRWSRSAMLSLINGAVLGFLGSQKTSVDLFLYVGIGGFLLCVFWRTLNWKTQLWIDYWHRCLAKMEPPESNLLVFRVFTGIEWEKVNKEPTFHRLLNFLPWAFVLLWAGLIIWSLSFHHKERPVNNPPIIFFQLNTKGGGQ